MKNQSITEAMLQFIEESPTAFHAAAKRRSAAFGERL